MRKLSPGRLVTNPLVTQLVNGRGARTLIHLTPKPSAQPLCHLSWAHLSLSPSSQTPQRLQAASLQDLHSVIKAKLKIPHSLIQEAVAEESAEAPSGGLAPCPPNHSAPDLSPGLGWLSRGSLPCSGLASLLSVSLLKITR